MVYGARAMTLSRRYFLGAPVLLMAPEVQSDTWPEIIKSEIFPPTFWDIVVRNLKTEEGRHRISTMCDPITYQIYILNGLKEWDLSEQERNKILIRAVGHWNLRLADEILRAARELGVTIYDPFVSNVEILRSLLDERGRLEGRVV